MDDYIIAINTGQIEPIKFFDRFLLEYENLYTYDTNNFQDEPYGIVYMVINTINNKKYVGVSIHSFKQRYHGNMPLNTHNKHLKRSIEEYGIENFKIIEEYAIGYSKEHLDYLEDEIIVNFNLINPSFGYNKKRGGSNGTPGDEAKKKNSESHKGKGMGEDNGFYGKHHTAENREEQSRRMSGENNPMYGKGYLVSGSKNPRARAVVCIEDSSIVFYTIDDAAKWCGVSRKTIHNSINGKAKAGVGKHPETGMRLHWLYYEDFLVLVEENELLRF